MNRPLIVMGDPTTHGGTVISADMTFEVNGKFAARVNDMTVCPRCKGTFPIVSGADDMKDGAGNAYARHMDRTACGAQIISSQVTSFWGSESSSREAAEFASPSQATPATPASVAAPTPSLCLECLAAAAARGESIVPRG